VVLCDSLTVLMMGSAIVRLELGLCVLEVMFGYIRQ
jgi:hypothetical protein